MTWQAELQVAVLHQLAEALLLQQAVDEGHVLGQVIVQNHAAHGGFHVLLDELDGLGVDHVLVIEGVHQIDDAAGVAELDGGEGFDLAHFEGDEHVVGGGEGAALALGAGTRLGEVVAAQHHVLGGNGDGAAMRRRENIVGRQHQGGRFDLRFGRKRNVDGHLVAVEIGVEGGADQGMNLDGLAFHQHRLEGLNAQAVQGGGAVEQNGMVLDDLFEDVPHHRVLLFDQFLGLLDGGAVAALFEAVIDEGLEQLERHFLGQAALVQAQLRTDHDDGAAGIIHALAEQVLAEAALLALERIGEGLERAVVGAAQHAAAAAVVEQGVHGLLQHALFVAHDHVGSVQFDELFQAVIAVDDAAIEVVEIGSGEAAAIERHQRTQLGRNHGQHVENHPLRLVAGLAERFHHAQALGELQLLLLRLLGLHLFADLFAESFHVDLLEQLLDAFGAHHGDELAGELLVELALALVGDDFAAGEAFHLAGLDHDVSFEVEDALELAQGDIEQVADAAGQTLEKPHVGAGAGQLDVAEAFAAHARQGHFHAALVANHAAVFHALVFAAQAFPVLGGAENAGAEQAVALGFKGPVVDGLRLGDFAVGPAPDFFRRSQGNADGIEIRDQIRSIVRRGSQNSLQFEKVHSHQSSVFSFQFSISAQPGLTDY